jgi:hypothetical protein
MMGEIIPDNDLDTAVKMRAAKARNSYIKFLLIPITILFAVAFFLLDKSNILSPDSEAIELAAPILMLWGILYIAKVNESKTEETALPSGKILGIGYITGFFLAIFCLLEAALALFPSRSLPLLFKSLDYFLPISMLAYAIVVLWYLNRRR